MPTQTSWNWMFLLQPGATIAAACIVLSGVIITLRSNAQRLRSEQLEKRAKDKEARLQAAYAEFSSAAFQVIRYLGEIAFSNDIVRGAYPDADEAAAKDDLKQEVASLKSHRTVLASAYARLLLIEEDADRLRLLATMFKHANGWTSRAANHHDFKWYKEVRGFCWQIGALLEAQYRRERLLAEQGASPPMVIRLQSDDDDE